MTPIHRSLLFVIAGSLAAIGLAGEAPLLFQFKRQKLTDVYYSEGANAGDLNNDGKPDVVYGPYWFEGPDFKTKHEIYLPKPQNKEGYADNFFSWIYDFNGDGWADIFVVGFPGKPAYIYENPKGDFSKQWPKHQVFDSVANESPHFTNIVGDDRPELVCANGGRFGFATIDWKDPFKKWTFHAISPAKTDNQFGHGLGVGDVDGDGRLDIISVKGWFQQPKADPETTPWTFHEAQFTDAYGGAEMYAYDVDGDGLNDIITSLGAHDYGLAWYQQDKSGPVPVFRQHLIMGKTPKQSRYGTLFTEPHSVALHDMDGDGLKDIVTGRTYYSHHKQSPMWDAGPVVYWFQLKRTKDGVDWVPHEIDGASGIGRQVSIVDVNGDKLPDVVVGGMLGAHVLFQSRTKVDSDKHAAAQPKALTPIAPILKRGPFPVIDNDSGRIAGVLEAEELKIAKITGGKTSVQDMTGFKKDRWSGGKQLFWSGAKAGDRLTLSFEVAAKGTYAVDAAFTMARDFGAVRIELDDNTYWTPVDLYNFPDVLSTGARRIGDVALDAGPHTFTIHVVDANPAALGGDKLGIDYLRVTPK
jgi:hypothetical protein